MIPFITESNKSSLELLFLIFLFLLSILLIYIGEKLEHSFDNRKKKNYIDLLSECNISKNISGIIVKYLMNKCIKCNNLIYISSDEITNFCCYDHSIYINDW
jgi:hypothetical protein